VDEQIKEWRERWNNGDVKFVPELLERLEAEDKIDKEKLLLSLKVVINEMTDRKVRCHQEGNERMETFSGGMIAGFKTVQIWIEDHWRLIK